MKPNVLYRGLYQLPPALVATLCCAAQTAHAAGPRYSTVFSETVDGQAQANSSADLALTRELIKAGVTFIDEAQSRKIRSVTDAGQLMAGGIPPVITTLDADVIVAAVARATKVESSLLGGNAFRYDGVVEARVMAVANGEVLGAFSVHGAGFATSASESARAALEKAGAGLAKEILANVKKGGEKQRIEVSIGKLPNVGESERIAQAVGRIEGAGEVTVLQSGRSESKLAVETALTARALAVAIEKLPDIGLEVFGYNDRAIKAEFSAARATRWPVVFTRLQRTGGTARDDRDAVALAGMIGIALSGLDLLDPAFAGEVVDAGQSAASRKKVLDKLPAGAERALILAGTLRPKGKELEVEARILSPSGDVIIAGQRRCVRAELSSCASALGAMLAEGLPAKLEAKRSLFGAKAKVAKSGPRDPGERPLEIVAVELEDLFPSQIARYATQPIGKLRMRNNGKKPLKAITLSAQVARFMATPLDVSAGDLAPGATREVPIKLVLDAESFASHNDTSPGTLTVTLSYPQGDLRLTETRSSPILVHARTALSWAQGDAIASFVTPRQTDVLRDARAAHAAASARPKPSRSPLALPAALFAAMGARKLHYVPDPANPYSGGAIDYIQYPAETLRTAAGDCDDLAVLYAALAEAVDLPVLMITTPGHIFAAAWTGVPARSAASLWPQAGHFITYRREAWIPIETTLAGSSFALAWQTAAREVAEARSRGQEPGIIDVRLAGKRFPPVSLSGGAAALQPLDGPALASALDAGMRELEQRRVEDVGVALKALEKRPVVAATSLQKGVLLALAGRRDEASKAFETSLKGVAKPAEAANDLANLELLAGHAAEAHAKYLEVLAWLPAD